MSLGRFTQCLALAALTLWCAGAHAQSVGAVDEHEAAVEAADVDAPDAHGGHGAHDLGHGNAGPGLENMAEARTDLAVYTFAVFMLLMAGLSSLVWPKVSHALEEREKRIEAEIVAAAAKHEEAKKLLAEHEAKLASTAAEVRAMLEEARRDAESTKDGIVAEARKAADQERQRALRDIEIATGSATQALAEQSANLAVELAGKAIRETLVPSKRAELVREALAKLSETSPSKN